MTIRPYNSSIPTSAAERALLNAERVHQPPPGLFLKPGEQTEYWNFLMKTRAYDEWSPADLTTAYNIVKIEGMIRRGQKRIDELIDDGADFLDPESIAADYFKQFSQLQKHQMLLLRSIGFTRTAQRAIEGRQVDAAKKERSTADLLAGLGGRLPSMLATQ
jgi:hypothetical protein